MKHTLGLGDHFRGRSESLKSNRSSTDEIVDPAGDDTTVVEPDQGNVLSHIISQLRPGADLSRVTLPTFILEERSMLERITNFFAHPENLLPIPEIDDPLQRFIGVVKYYLSGWHIKPPGVKKPLNPILGETFTGWWDYPDGTRGYYISEQTSHHPPKSSYFFIAPEHHIRADGCLRPRSKFLGNSAASLMEGISYLRLTNRGSSKGGEKYILTQPNMYARGILFGKMKYELGDHSYIRCPENGFSADIEFKVKGWVGGTYNAIGGVIKNDKTGESLYELSGMWNGEMIIKDLKSGQKKPLFDATHAKHTPPKARPLEEQGERESQKLWKEVVRAVHVSDHENATTEKSKIEDQQREEAKKREAAGEEWKPKLFRPVDPSAGEDDLEWVLDVDIDPKADPKAIVDQVLGITAIVPGQKFQSRSAPTPEAAPRRETRDSTVKPSASANSVQSNNLIDFGSSSSIAASPVQTQPVAPQPSQGNATPVHQQTAVTQPSSNPPLQTRSLLDDEHGMNDQMANMKIQQPIQPRGNGPIARTDTQTSDLDIFVDAESGR